MNDLNSRKKLWYRGIFFACLIVPCVLANLFRFCQFAVGQALPQAPSSPSNQSSYNNNGSSSNSASGSSSQATNPGAALRQSPFSGSVPEGKATTEILPLSFKDAIDRGLRNNLGIL